MSPLRRARWRATAVVALLALGAPAFADPVLQIGTVVLDAPTPMTIGLQLMVAGDDDYDARVAVRYRAAGEVLWHDALPLFRVHPETVSGRVVPAQFAGSIFDLTPAASYEIELHATDPDGPVDMTVPLSASTRGVPPFDPASPAPVPVTDGPGLQAALTRALPGQVILLADGAYPGPFTLAASGSVTNPIVIRGTSTAATIVTGGLVVDASFVHVERLTLRDADTALRFDTMGATGNVVRRVHVDNVRVGIVGRPRQRDFYLCDNDLTGRLLWPQAYPDDGGAHANDDGIRVQGAGHVVCHNRVVGFGDALKVGDGAERAIDFYGNEVLSAYDDGVELDYSEGNTRVFRNRFTNVFEALSFQPVYGGPVYAFRNVVVNVGKETLKFHNDPSGILVLHNTFVCPGRVLDIGDASPSYNFLVAANLFVGPAPPPLGVMVQWHGMVDGGTFDGNAWFPDGRFDFGAAGNWASFAAMQTAGVFETHGVLLDAGPFASGLVPPPSYTATLLPQDATLEAASAARDQARLFPNINDGSPDDAPDLGALELDCPPLLFGPRPEGVDESNQPRQCGAVPPTTTSTTTTSATVPGTTSTTSTTLPWITIRTSSLTLRDKSGAHPERPRRSIKFRSVSRADPPAIRIVPPAPGSVGDPTVRGGRLMVYNAAGRDEFAAIALPAMRWAALGRPRRPRGWIFRGRDGDAIAKVTVVADRIVVRGASAWPYALDERPQRRIALRLALGTSGWCTEAPAAFRGSPLATGKSDRAGRFRAQPDTPPPPRCTPLP